MAWSVFEPGVRQNALVWWAEEADVEFHWETGSPDDDTRTLTLVMLGADGIEANVSWVRNRRPPGERTDWTPWRQVDPRWPVRFTENGGSFMAKLEWLTEWLVAQRKSA
jgi:hypothetical protein